VRRGQPLSSRNARRPLRWLAPRLAAVVVALGAACAPGGPPPVAPRGPPLSLAEAVAAAPPTPHPDGRVRVAFAGPVGATRTDGEISVVFDRPMRTLGLGDAELPPPATIAPAAKGAFHWLGSSAIRFDAEEPLTPATAYRVEIPAGTRALDGTTLAEPFALELETPRPRLVESWPPVDEPLAPDASFTLVFDQTVLDREILRTVSLRSERGRVALPYRIERLEAKQPRGGVLPVTLTPAKPLPLGDRIRLHVDESLAGARGGLRAGVSRDLVFETLGPPSVRRVGCAPRDDGAPGCDPDDPTLTIELTSPVPAAALAKAIVLTPPAAWDREGASTDERVDVFTLRPALRPATRYRLAIDPARGGRELADAWGQRLVAPPPVELRVGNRVSEVTLGLRGTYWSASARHDLPVWVTNATHATFTAAPLPLASVLAELAARAAPSGPLARVVELASGRLDETQKHELRLDELLPGVRGPVRISGLGGASAHVEDVQVTDLAVSARVAHGGAAVRITGLDDDKPVVGGRVDAYLVRATPPHAAPEPLGTAVTGADGLADVALGAPIADRDRVAIVASRGADWTYATVRAPRRIEPVGLLYSERGIYRPGEVVRLSGVFRVPGPRGLETPVGARVTIDTGALHGPAIEATLSAFGTFAVDVPVPADARIGHASLGAHIASTEVAATKLGEIWTTIVVAEYRPTAIEVVATVDREEHVRGDVMTCVARGRYLHGGPVVGGRATATLRRSSAWHGVPGTNGFTLVDASATSPHHQLARLEGVLDAKGEAQFRVPLTLTGMTGAEHVSCEVEVQDLDRRALTSLAGAEVHPGEIYVALENPPEASVVQGSTLPLRATAVTPGGDRHEARVHLEALLRVPGEEPDRVLGGCDVTTGEELVGCSIVVPWLAPVATSTADILVRGTAVDRRGNTVRASWTVTTRPPPKPAKPRPPEPAPAPPEPELRVGFAKRGYAVGETATLSIASPLPGAATALVTVEREGILWRGTVDLAGATASVDVPITAAMIPNAEVFVSVVAKGAVAHASASFDVDPAPKSLRVVLDTGGTRHAPGDPLDVAVTVTDATGRPARAEVTLYAADEASLALVEYRTPDPHYALFRDRWSSGVGVETRDDLVHVGDRRRRHLQKPPSVRMGGTMRSRREPREDFRQTVFFAPHLLTDAGGRVSQRIKLPDGLTAYRFIAVAVAADDRAGSAQATVQTSLPLMARASLPRVIRAGDRFEVSVVVTSTEASTAEVEVDATGLTLDGPLRRSVAVVRGAPREVRFPVRAERAGAVRVAAKARLGEGEGAPADATSLRAEVVAPMVLESVALDGETRSVVAERLGALGGVRADVGGLELAVSTGPLAGLAEGVRQLLEYPYGCTEQTASRMVPLLALRDLARGLDASLPADVDAALGEAVRRLARNQRADGGFGLWPESGASEPWVSAWALWAIAEARRRGVAVPEGVEARAQAYLERDVSTASLTDEGLVRAAFLVDQAAEGSTPRSASATALRERVLAAREQLPPDAQALLLHALAVLGEQPEAQRALSQSLANLVRLDGATATAVIAPPGGEPWGASPTFASRPRTTAMILRALLAAAPAHPLVPKLARGLLAARRGGRFRTTHEAAWALLALDALRRRDLAGAPSGGAAASGTDARVYLGPSLLLDAHLEMAAPPRSLVVPMRDLLASAGAPLTFAASGGGPLSYSARFRFARAEPPDEPLERGMFVRRTLRALSSQGRPSGTFLAGELVEVVVDVATPSPRSFVVIESPLPGGFEAADVSLRAGGAEVRDESRGGRRELHDDRVVHLFDVLPGGVTTVRDVVRATTPGTFVLPPARAEEMYAPETTGRTAAERVVVAVP
jgi:uncharacterized protein YfaS (alpha-2-macroglobulin family)